MMISGSYRRNKTEINLIPTNTLKTNTFLMPHKWQILEKREFLNQDKNNRIHNNDEKTNFLFGNSFCATVNEHSMKVSYKLQEKILEKILLLKSII